MDSELKLAGTENAKIISRDGHSISRKDIAPNALKVLYRLTSAGYHAHIVGGGIRDLLLKKKPKDFDIATDATPEEVKNLFRNGHIIGRRFKIVHVRFGREIIEVTTFRANHARSNELSDNPTRHQIKGLDSAHSESGMILRDNVYGNIDEDALRRDFTINALYYTTDGFRVLDFCSGMDDLKAKKIRIIGNPIERYKEDPVRMLRAIRFAAKLDFTIEENTQEPIDELSYLLDSISSARLFDETLKLMTGGYAERTFEMLRRFQLGTYLFAPTLEALSESDGSSANLVFLALKNTDDRLAKGKSVTPAFLFASLLWPVLKLYLAKSKNLGLPPQKAFQQAVQSALSEQLHYTAIPKRFTLATREIWELQQKLGVRTKRNVDRVFNSSRFRAAYDFLLLREESGEDLNGLGQWWTDFQVSDSETKLKLITKVQKRRTKKNRSQRGHGE
jgi:poly(A) polymerase